MPLISFILPVYNVEKYLARCLDSIYALSLEKEQFEVLCIDDCSIDKSTTIIETYQEQYSNLHLIKHQQNARQGAARNTGIRNAKGAYCMFVDADDSIPKVDLLAYIEYMQQHDLELLLGKANVIGCNGEITQWGNSPVEESRIMKGPEIFIEEYIHKVAFGVVWLGIYKMELVKRISPFLENIQYEDTDWTLRCAYEAQLLQYRPIVLYNYHNNPATTTTTKSIRSLIERTKQSLRIYEWAQTTTYLRSDVLVAVEDYVRWNLRILNGLYIYTYKELKSFYQSFTIHELQTIAALNVGQNIKIILKFPKISQLLFCILNPIYKIYKNAKSNP